MAVLTLEQAKEMFDIYNTRRSKFPEEGMETSFLVVLLNYGDQYTKVWCTNGEWNGNKYELQPRDGIPLCPNGHPLFESGKRLRLGLVEE